MCVDHSTQLGVVCKPAEGALNSIVDVIDKGVKEHQSLYWTPLVTSVSCLPFLHLGMESSCALGQSFLKDLPALLLYLVLEDRFLGGFVD